ncbi:hypothetical protein Ancab_002342 [Ancistrocladus abbreviatus]
MAPEHRCPTQYYDGFETLKFIDRSKIDGFPPNADIGKCFIAGDSSGGYMSHHMAVRAVKHNFQAQSMAGDWRLEATGQQLVTNFWQSTTEDQ